MLRAGRRGRSSEAFLLFSFSLKRRKIITENIGSFLGSNSRKHGWTAADVDRRSRIRWQVARPLLSPANKLIVLAFLVNTVSCASNNTTQFDNFTIVWENFSVLSCAVPTPINVSLFVCLPPVTYLPLDDMTCLQQTMIDFDLSTCSSTGSTMLYSKGTTGVQQQVVPARRDNHLAVCTWILISRRQQLQRL